MKVAIYILSAAFEVGGIAASIVELVRRARRTKDYLRRGVTVRVRGVAGKVRIGRPTVTGGAVPSVENRIAALERRVAQAEQAQVDAEDRLASELRQYAETVGKDVEATMRETFQHLETAVGLSETSRLGVAAVVMLLLGIGLGLWGNLL